MQLSRKVYITVTTLSSIAALIGIILATSANFTFGKTRRRTAMIELRYFGTNSTFVFSDLLLRTQMVVSPNSLNFKFWSELPEPIKTSVFLFNVTNYEDFISKGAKPELVGIFFVVGKIAGRFVLAKHTFRLRLGLTCLTKTIKRLTWYGTRMVLWPTNKWSPSNLLGRIQCEYD